MAEQKSRIYSLPEITEINDDMYLMLDASDTGARRFNLKTFYDKVDGVQASADAANTAATAAAAAVDSANQAAQQAASAAESASTTVQGLVNDVDEALDAIEDISEQAVPLMSENVRGGAKLGTGLDVTDGTLSVNTTASGDGSQAGPILSLSAKGWAEQDSTTGKNLLPSTATSKTVNGVTFTINADGSVTAKGTATKSTEFAIASFSTTSDFKEAFPPATYTISGCRGGNDSTYYMRIVGRPWAALKTQVDSGVTFDSNTLVTNDDGCYIVIGVSNGITIDKTFYPQIEANSTATAYEPYTGGAPSPSPSFPQEIRVCRGRNLMTTVGRVTRPTTDFDPSSQRTIDGTGIWPIIAANGYVRSFAIGSVSITPDLITLTNIQSTAYGVGFEFNVSPLETYTISYDASLPKSEARIGYFNSDGTNMLSTGGFSSGTSFTVPAGCHLMIVVLTGTNDAQVDKGKTATFANFQLERGSVAHGYVPYGDYVGMEAQSRNLLNLLSSTGGTDAGITVTPNGDGTFKASGTATTGSVNVWLAGNYGSSRALFILPAGTYTVTDCRLFSNTQSLNVADIGGAATFTLAQETPVTGVRFPQSSTGQVVNTNIKPQLEKGSTATEYEPYYHTTTPIPLPSRGWVASLPDGTADTLTLDGAGKVTWERKCEEVVLDGIAYTAASVGTFTLANRASIIPAVSNARAHSDSTGFAKDLLSDHFVPNNYVITLTNNAAVGGIAIFSNNVLYITVAKSFNTAESVSAWLRSNPVTVLYPLATPVTEERGYIEMPEIPVGAEISIPELDDLGVKYCVDASARDLAMMWYDRARGEYAGRLDGLDDDLVDTYGEIISANARIDTVSMDEDYDRQALNGTYAGRNIQTILGTNSFDATISALHSRIASANFSGLRVGDFLNVNCGAYGTVRFDIAHFDPYYQIGSSAMGHHIAFVAHTPIALPSGDAYGIGTNNTYLAWNTTNTNQGTEAENCPYLASHLHDWEINKLLPAMPTSLTNNLINRWEWLETRYSATGGLTASQNATWKQLGKVWSLSEMEVYGSVVWGTPAYSVGISRQFDIFRNIWSQLHGQRTDCWLRTPSGLSASDVCDVGYYGIAYAHSAMYDWVRPRPGFLLG